jgi:serine/threonine protein kinase
VRTDTQWKLIDLDASCRIGVDGVGIKSSSAYVPPEVIHANKSSGVAFVKSARTCVEFNHSPLMAHPSFDVWSLGCLLYQMCSNGKPLFQGSTDDNLSGEAKDMQKEDSLWGLAEWSSELKAKKLSEISNPFAANLISLLLEKDPLKRPTLSRVLAHPFLTGKKGTRMVGEVPIFDVFISYRVACGTESIE